MVCEHLDTSLAGQDVDGPSSQAVGSLTSFQMDSSHVVHSHGDRFLRETQFPEQIRSTEIEVVGGHGGVSHDIQYMGAILGDVKLDLELPQEGVPLVFVNGDLESVGPGIESTEWIIHLDIMMQLGR